MAFIVSSLYINCLLQYVFSVVDSKKKKKKLRRQISLSFEMQQAK